ncbi:phosphate ABC transporter permease PstA [Provencibacterium massiliense]|uniref:phosphate ABC transporter permease PstA n=1 Tax=Provencibacterium massiliense TaxID=1841868 RepID=UPI0009A60672|nr:phosphate ABC transporter permease PstA [Provencibacterium massiliense]
MKKIIPINRMTLRQRLRNYLHSPLSFLIFLLVTLAALFSVFILLFLVVYILIMGIPHLTPELFAFKYDSDNVSMFPAIITTVQTVVLSLLIAAPLGIGCAIYLTEYAKKSNRLVPIIRLTAETLSGIPSIVYGLFGMLFFVTALHWGFSLLAGVCTLSIMVLPVVMRSTEEALLSVPNAYREASFGLGAGRLHTILKVVLPSAVPGILAGMILAIGRIIGETAALIYTAGTVAQIPKDVFQSGRTLAIHMYALSNEGLHVGEAYATAVVLLLTVLLINTFASVIAKKIAKV